MMTSEQSFTTKIEEILKYFDFKRVEKFMKADNWKYHDTPAGRTPNIEELKASSSSLLRSAIKEHLMDGKAHRHQSGGFLAIVDHDGELDLHFIIASAEDRS